MRLRELPVGAKVSDYRREFSWLIADQEHPIYEGTVLMADMLAEAGCYDAPEPDSRFDTIRQFGWNRYPVSNVHCWLNSEEDDWYAPAHGQDMPPAELEPYVDKPGFLTGFSETFRNALLTVDVTYCIQDDYYQTRHLSVPCRVFLPSRTELGMEDRKGIAEGSRLALCDIRRFLNSMPSEELTAAHHLCDRDFHPTTAYPYWLRSVDLSCMSAVYFCGMSRQPWFHACQVSCGIRPLAVMDPETELEDRPDRYGVYHVKGEQGNE